jgi:hypothetical protein
VLEVFGVFELIDVKPCIERLHRNHDVYELKAARQLIAQVNQAFSRLAHERRGNYNFSINAFRLR